MTCVHKVRWSVKRPEDCRFRLSVSHYKDRIVAPDEYSGVTVITPSDTEQVLATKDKLVRDDITVYPVPEPDLRPLSISENGTYEPDGFDGYSSVTADIEPNLTSLAVTENGLYLPESGADGFDRVSVDVPIPTFATEEKTVTENGVYLPSAGKDGISKVTVNVPSQAPVLDSLSVTENGTYTPSAGIDGFDEVVVNVPTGGGTIGTFIKSVTIEAPAGRASVSYSAKDMLTLFELSDAGIYLILAENNDITNEVNAVFLFKMSADATTTDNGFKFITLSKDWTTSNASRAAQVLCANGAILKLYQLPVPIVQ